MAFKITTIDTTGDGSFQVSADPNYGREGKSLGTAYVRAGSITRTVTINQDACPQHVSKTQNAIDNSGMSNTGIIPDATTSEFIFYSNAKYFTIEKDPYQSGGSIYSWNSKGHNYDEENTSVKYSDASIKSVTIGGQPATATNGTYSAGNSGKTTQYAVKVTFNIPTNSDNEAITRRFKIHTYGDNNEAVTNQDMLLTIVQDAGVITLIVSKTSVNIPWPGTAQTITVTSNTTWTVKDS